MILVITQWYLCSNKYNINLEAKLRQLLLFIYYATGAAHKKHT